MRIQLIWAQDEKGGIGQDGKLPWHISEDLKNFKNLTNNHPIIMGRLTWESLPLKPLPNRRNIILSKNNISNFECYNNINDCIQALKNDKIKSIFIIGGASIYLQFLTLASDLHITLIHKKTDGIDCFFPKSIEQLKTDFKLSIKKELCIEATYMHWQKK